MTELIEIETGIKRIGFIDYDKMMSKYMFIYFDNEKNTWTSEKLGMFKPEYKVEKKIINEEKENGTDNGLTIL